MVINCKCDSWKDKNAGDYLTEMVDARTEEYLRHLRKTLEKAEEICQCGYCKAEREKKQISQCDMNARLEHLPDKIFRNPIGFTTELSSNPWYWRLGRRG